MADATSSPDKHKPLLDPIPQQPDPDKTISQPDPSSSTPTPPPPTNPNPNPNLPQLASPSIHPQPPRLQVPPSFRPAPPPPLPLPPQFSPIPNANFHPQNNVVQPPGVAPVPGSLPGPDGLVYAQLPNQNVRPPYMQLPNGYMPLPPPVSSS